MVAVSTWMWPIHVMENFKNSVRTVQIWWAWKISYVKCRPLCIGMFCVTLHMHTKCQEDIWNFSGARTITSFGMGGQEDPSTPMSDRGSKKNTRLATFQPPYNLMVTSSNWNCFSLLNLCEGIPPVIGGILSPRVNNAGDDLFFDVSLCTLY